MSASDTYRGALHQLQQGYTFDVVRNRHISFFRYRARKALPLCTVLSKSHGSFERHTVQHDTDRNTGLKSLTLTFTALTRHAGPSGPILLPRNRPHSQLLPAIGTSKKARRRESAGGMIRTNPASRISSGKSSSSFSQYRWKIRHRVRISSFSPPPCSSQRTATISGYGEHGRDGRM